MLLLLLLLLFSSLKAEKNQKYIACNNNKIYMFSRQLQPFTTTVKLLTINLPEHSKVNYNLQGGTKAYCHKDCKSKSIFWSVKKPQQY